MTTFGFVGYEDIAGQRVDSGNMRIVDEAIQASVDEHNRQVAAALRELVEVTTEHQVRYRFGGAGTLQPLDEWGNPRPVKDGGHYDVAFPIQGGGTAWGNNRVSRALMTVGEADELTDGMLRRDADWMRRHIVASLFDNTTWTYTDPLYGALTIQPLANGDGVNYLRRNGTQAADTHFLAQAAAISDAANPLPAWRQELAEHPENEGPYVVYIPSNLRDSVMGLANFRDNPDPNVEAPSTEARLTGRIDRGFGDEVLGYVDRMWIVEWSFLPDNYGLVVARGASRRTLGMREYPSPALRGLFTERNSPDGNLSEYRFIRYAGFGVYNRVGSLAFRIGNGAYAVPTGYTTPLPA